MQLSALTKSPEIDLYSRLTWDLNADMNQVRYSHYNIFSQNATSDFYKFLTEIDYNLYQENNLANYWDTLISMYTFAYWRFQE